jgi:DNA-binding NtrC family response regulator
MDHRGYVLKLDERVVTTPRPTRDRSVADPGLVRALGGSGAAVPVASSALVGLASRGGALSQQLARFHRHALSNVLVLYGTRAGRDRVARSFHSSSANPAGTYYRFDCAEEEDRLRSTMRAWIAADGCADEPAALLGDGRGTLFLDAVDVLSGECQRLLLIFSKRLTEAAVSGQAPPIGRLITGSPTNLESEVAAGRFAAQLYDALNKVRVDLRRAPTDSSRGGDSRCTT